MIFKVGDTVVYPHHGAALIEAIETRTIKGEPKEYLVLKVAQPEATRDALIAQAEGAYQQALDELETKTELRKRNPDVVTTRELERLQNLADGRFGSLEAARAQKTVAENNFKTVLPAQLASAEAVAESDRPPEDKWSSG